MTGASSGTPSTGRWHHWFAGRSPRSSPSGHLETEHRASDTYRCGGLVQEASLQSRRVGDSDDRRHKARTSRADSDRDIRSGECSSIRCSGRPLLHGHHGDDRQQEREHHQNRSKNSDRQHRSGPSLPISSGAHQRPPSSAQLEALTVIAPISPIVFEPTVDAVTQASSPRCSTRRVVPITMPAASSTGSPRATLRAAIAATC